MSDPSSIIALTSSALFVTGVYEGASIYTSLSLDQQQQQQQQQQEYKEKNKDERNRMMIPSIMAYGVCSVPLSIVGASPCGYQTLQSLGFFPNANAALSLYAHPSTLLQNQQQQQQEQEQQGLKDVAINQTEKEKAAIPQPSSSSSQQQQQQRKNINRKMKVPLIRSTNTQNNNTMEEQENQAVVQQQQQQRLRRLRQPPPLPFHATSSSETTETDKETKNNDDNENDEKQNNTHSEFKSLANRFREQNKQARATTTPQSQSQQQQQQTTTTTPLIRNIPTTKLTSSSPSQHPIPLTSSSIFTTPSSSSSSTILSSSLSSKYITLQNNNNNNNNHHLFFINNNNATPEVTRRVRFVIATIGLVTTLVSYQLHCYNQEKEEEEDEMYKVEKYLAKNRRSGNGGGGGTVLRLLNPNQSFPPFTNGDDEEEENRNVCILPVVYTPLSAYSLQKEEKRMHWKLGKSPKEYMNFTPLSSDWFFYDDVSKKDNDADQNKNKTEEEDMKKPFLLMEANISTPFYSHITTHSTAPSSSSSNTNVWSKLNTLLNVHSSKKKNENEKTMKSLPSSAQNNNDENSHDGLTIHQVRNASRILDTIASKRIVDDSSGVDNECKNNVKVVNVLMETTDQQQQYNDNHHHNENEITLNGVKAVENRLKSLLYQKIKKKTTRNIPKKADNEKNLAMSSVQKEVVDVDDKDEEEKDASASSGCVTNNIESQTNEKGEPKEKETTTIQTQTIEELQQQQQQPQVQEMYSSHSHNNNNNNNNYFSILSIIDTIGSNIRQSGEYAANTIITSSIQVVRRQKEWKNYCINYWKERNLVEQVKKNAKMIFLSFTFLPSLESMSLLPLSMPLFKKQERQRRQRQVLYVVSNDQRVAWWVQNMLDLDELNVVWIDSAKSTDGSGSGAISPVAASANDVDPSMTSTSTTLAVSSVSLNHGSTRNTNMEGKSAADKEEDKDGIILVCCTNDDANCDVACSILSSRNDLAESGKMIVLFENQSSKDTFDLLTRQILISSSSSLLSSSSSEEKEVQVEEQNQRNDSGGSGAINESGIDSICVESIYEEMFDYTRWLLGKGKSLSEVQSIMMNDDLSIKERTKKG